jgi:hypothetical protein
MCGWNQKIPGIIDPLNGLGRIRICDLVLISVLGELSAVPGGLNGAGLNGSKVFNDRVIANDECIDSLTAGSGLDWFIVAVNDKTLRRINSETVTHSG